MIKKQVHFNARHANLTEEEAFLAFLPGAHLSKSRIGVVAREGKSATTDNPRILSSYYFRLKKYGYSLFMGSKFLGRLKVPITTILAL